MTEHPGSDRVAASRFVARGVAAAVEHPWRVIGGWLAMLALALLGIARLEIDTATNSFLDQESPAWQIYQRSLDHYGGDEFLVVAFEIDEPFGLEGLERVTALTRRLEGIAGVRRVDSLASVPLIRGSDDDELLLDSGLSGGPPGTEAERQAFLYWLGRDRLAPRSLISADGRIFALNLMLDEAIVSDRAQIVADVRAALEGLPAWITGVPVFRSEVVSHTRDQVLVFVPVTLLLLGLVLALALRGGQAVGIAIVVGGAGSAASLGAMGATGVPLSLTTTVLPSVLLALGCAYSMHVLTVAHERSGEALARALQSVAPPIALSGLTTVIGFLAMATVRLDAVRELATFGAVGVFVATAASLTLAPAILSLRPLGGAGVGFDGRIRHAARRRLMGFVARRSRAIITVWVVMLGVFALGISRIEVATDITEWFARGADVRDSYEAVRERLSGITPVNVLIESDGDEGGDVTRPEVVASIDGLVAALEARPEVGKAFSFSDSLRQVHAVVMEDASAGLPDDATLIAQYLILLDGIDRMLDVLRRDHSGANILLRVDDNSSAEIVALGQWVEAWWAENGVAGYRAHTTGVMFEFGRAEEEIVAGQIRGLGLAMATIGAILLLVYRNFGTAVMGLAANVIPIAVTFGLMGWVGIGLDAGTAIFGSMALGIGVDDTIHVLTAYRDQRERGEKPLVALDRALEHVLPPLVFSTAAIGVGFAALMLSDFALVRNLGIVTACVVVLCLLADTTLLPALVLRREAWRSRRGYVTG